MQSVERDKVLATRRDLLGDPLSTEVQSWLRPIYLRPSAKAITNMTSKIVEMVSMLGPMTKKAESVGTAVQQLSAFVSRPLGPQYLKMFEIVKRPQASVLRTFVSVTYARALLLLAATAEDAAKVVPCFKDILSRPGSFEQGLRPYKKLDEHFVGHLIALTEIEAQLDPYIRTVLWHSAELFVNTHRPHHDSTNPLADQKSGLDLLSSKHQESWWWLPAGVAFSLTIWDQDVV